MHAVGLSLKAVLARVAVWIYQKSCIVKPRLSGLIGTSVNSPDNRESGFIIKKMNINEIQM